MYSMPAPVTRALHTLEALMMAPETMPCPCGAEVPMVDGAYADGSGLYCNESCLNTYGDDATNGR